MYKPPAFRTFSFCSAISVLISSFSLDISSGVSFPFRRFSKQLQGCRQVECRFRGRPYWLQWLRRHKHLLRQRWLLLVRGVWHLKLRILCRSVLSAVWQWLRIFNRCRADKNRLSFSVAFFYSVYNCFIFSRSVR